jgi:hypothetical protein
MKKEQEKISREIKGNSRPPSPGTRKRGLLDTPLKIVIVGAGKTDAFRYSREMN